MRGRLSGRLVVRLLLMLLLLIREKAIVIGGTSRPGRTEGPIVHRGGDQLSTRNDERGDMWTPATCVARRA